jgi:hypothetical protein
MIRIRKPVYGSKVPDPSQMSRIRELLVRIPYLIISGEADPARGVEMLPHGRIEPVLVHKLSLRREELHPVVPIKE